MNPNGFLFAAVLLAATLAAGCSKKPVDAYTLVTAGKEVLTRSQLQQAMPGGLSADDSTAFASAYIRNWINEKLIANVAREQVDMAEIDRLTAEYRQALIMSSYRRAMASQVTDTLSEETLRNYYTANRRQFVLERPLVKGVYLKVPSEAENLKQLRRLYNSDRPDDMDRLEKEAMHSAMHYDYFRDRWVDWEQIETRIPTNIQSPNSFLSQKKNLVVENDGFTYLLYISAYIPAGDAMPYEATEPLVKERLMSAQQQLFDTALLQDLYNKSVDNGFLKIY